MAFTSFPAGVLVLGAHFCHFPCLSGTLPLTEGIAVVCTLACESPQGQGVPFFSGPVHPHTRVEQTFGV